jgi:hypothetical protein
MANQPELNQQFAKAQNDGINPKRELSSLGGTVDAIDLKSVIPRDILVQIQ